MIDECPAETVFQYMLRINRLVTEVSGGGFWSIERPCERATNSEIRRWLEQSAVLINGKLLKPKDEVEYPVTQLVLFPKSIKRRLTLI